MDTRALEMLRGRVNRSLDLLGTARDELARGSRGDANVALVELETELECMLGRLTIAVEREGAW